MPQQFDFVVVGGGSAGAVIAARLSEDPSCRVALIEAGERPPDVELMPAATAALQKNPATDWMFTADPGKAGLGLRGGRMPVPRGKMLGGSSGLNYELDAIAAVVIGGTSLRGGRGHIWGTVVGMLLLTLISNMLTADHIDTNWQGLVRGAVILIAVLIQRGRKDDE